MNRGTNRRNFDSGQLTLPSTSFTLAPMVAEQSTTWMPLSRITFFFAAAL